MLLASDPMGLGHWDPHTLLLPRALQLGKQLHRHTSGTRPCPSPAAPTETRQDEFKLSRAFPRLCHHVLGPARFLKADLLVQASACV